MRPVWLQPALTITGFIFAVGLIGQGINYAQEAYNRKAVEIASKTPADDDCLKDLDEWADFHDEDVTPFLKKIMKDNFVSALECKAFTSFIGRLNEKRYYNQIQEKLKGE